MGATVYSVLVVDDQKDWCETLVRMVNELGHAAQGATTALAALRLLADGRFDIVLLDWKLVHELPHGDFGLLQTI
ncbi:MAG: response regulator, partial [Planctomycetes bacterium]|nr:response regulator [Planctomycetota bacterium]